jgi:hypothetical protein
MARPYRWTIQPSWCLVLEMMVPAEVATDGLRIRLE